MANKCNSKLFKILRGWGFSLVVAVLIATSFKSALADWNDIRSQIKGLCGLFVTSVSC